MASISLEGPITASGSLHDAVDRCQIPVDPVEADVDTSLDELCRNSQQAMPTRCEFFCRFNQCEPIYWPESSRQMEY